MPLTTAVRLSFGLLPEEVALAYGRATFGAVRHMPYDEAVLALRDPGQWGWFFTRYVVPGTLQEFPLCSFVKGDLHGHALSTGYVVAAVALAFSYSHRPPSAGAAWGSDPARATGDRRCSRCRGRPRRRPRGPAVASVPCPYRSVHRVNPIDGPGMIVPYRHRLGRADRSSPDRQRAADRSGV